MPITFHMLEAGAKAGAELRARILDSLKVAGKKAEALLPSANVDAVILENPLAVIPRLGVGGYCSGSHALTVNYDPENAHFLSSVESEIGSTFCHELHHCLRPNYGYQLGERFVAEGLACTFEEECGFRTPFYAIECSGEALLNYAGRALPFLDRTDLNFNEWVFGTTYEKNTGEFPYQCGYSLGYALVKTWLAHAGTSAAKAYDVETKTVLDAWRSGAINPTP